MKTKLLIFISALFVTLNEDQVFANADSQSPDVERTSPYGRQSLGSSLFLLGNLAPGDPPYYFLLNYGFQVNRNDFIFAEAITWTYYEPLGTYGSSDNLYPGKVRAYGIGAGYQRFIWKSLYITAQVTPFLQQFFGEDDKRILSGFQLYLQSRLGYRFELFQRRWFLEPSVAFNYWPVSTNFPGTFKEVERGKPDYYLFEPGLNFGFKF